MIEVALSIRRKYIGITLNDTHVPMRHLVPHKDQPPYEPFSGPIPGASPHLLTWVRGCAMVHHKSTGVAMYTPASLSNFISDYIALLGIVSAAPLGSFAHTRLQLLEVLQAAAGRSDGWNQERFKLHLHLNERQESTEIRNNPHRDFHNVRKVDVRCTCPAEPLQVDTHVHLAAAMNKKLLLRFIKGKLETEHDTPVHKDAEGNIKTLGQVAWVLWFQVSPFQVFEELGLSANSLTLDHLDMHADKGTYHRFDRFNQKYNPFGYSLLREIFMKTDNYMGGRYFAEILKGITNDLEENKYQMAEYRVSIYGKNPNEWSQLADWFTKHQVFSKNVRFLIQVYGSLAGCVESV